MRMKSARFLKELRQSPRLQQVLLRYSHALMAQIAQTAACNRFHVVQRRLARWLLMTRDRAQSKNFHLTRGISFAHAGRAARGRNEAAGQLQERKRD